MEPSASAMFTSAPFSRKAFTNQHVWSAGLFTVFNKAKLACSFCFSCFFSSCNRTRAMNDQTALLMRKVALRHLSLRHLSPAVRRFAMSLPWSTLRRLFMVLQMNLNGKKQLLLLRLMRQPLSNLNKSALIISCFSVQPHCPQALPCNALLAGEGTRSDRGW